MENKTYVKTTHFKEFLNFKQSDTKQSDTKYSESQFKEDLKKWFDSLNIKHNVDSDIENKIVLDTTFDNSENKS